MALLHFNPADWLVQTAVAGGVLLLVGAVFMAIARQPARRQRLGELALAGSLLAAGLAALPSWLPYSLPLLPATKATASTPLSDSMTVGPVESELDEAPAEHWALVPVPEELTSDQDETAALLPLTSVIM